MRKKPEVKVAAIEWVYHKDGSSTEFQKIISSADMPKLKEFERYRGTDELIAKFRARGRVYNRERLKEIGYARNHYLHVVDENGISYKLIRPELLEIIALKLAPSAVSQDKATKGKRANARLLREQWDLEAARIWQKHP